MRTSTGLTRRSLLTALSLPPAARWLRGQEVTFSAGVKVVNVYATVRDGRGQIVRNLTKDDFSLDEDGRRQTIRYFSQESDLPLTIGILVDTSGSTQRVLPDEQRASIQFLDQVMRPSKDVAFVAHFDYETELLQDLTSSQKALRQALDGLESANIRRARGGWPGYGSRRYARGGTVLYDAIFAASEEVMRKRPGRKAIILLSDGMDQGSRLSLSHAIEAAQRADSLVYAILFEDPDAVSAFGGFGRNGREPDGKEVMERFSRETGGRFVEVTRRMPIEKVFAGIEEDLRNQYSLGYTPEEQAMQGYRRIHLTTRTRGFTVQSREGYYPS